MDLAGTLCGGSVLRINSANILDTLAVGFSAVTVDLTGVSSVFAGVVSDATTQLSTSFEPLLTTVMEPAVRPVIEEQLRDGSTFAPTLLMPIQAEMARNNIQDAFQGLAGRGARLFGLRGDD